MNWNGDYVKCELCGAVMKRLGRHLNVKHKMSILDYKDQFPNAPTTNAKNVIRNKSRTTGRPKESKRAYIDEENVECLMCKKHFKLLSSHVTRAHQIDMKGYKKLFPGEPTVCLRESRRRSKTGKKNAAKTASITGGALMEMNKKKAEAATAQWANQKLRKKVIKAQSKGKRASETYRNSHADQLRRVRKTSKFKESVSAALSKTATKMWKDPDKRKAQRERLSQLQTERMHQGINTWTNHHTNRKNCIYTGPKGPITMRSSWEVKFANDLDSIGAQWEYEPEHFPYQHEGITKQYTPDFYVWELDSYIEIKPTTFMDDQYDAKMLGMAKAHQRIRTISEANYPFKDDSPLTTSIELVESLCW